MFALTPSNLAGNIVDCAAGPSSFNAELTSEARRVISCDPLFSLGVDEIRSRIDATHDTVVANARTARDEFVWRDITSPEHLGESRMTAMQRFLADYPKGNAEGRYLVQALPHLDFGDDAFDLALCSHFLFTYTEQFSVEFHVDAIGDMCRVAAKARVFPLLKSYGGKSPHLEPVVVSLRAEGFYIETRRVPYEFQRGGDMMLVASKPGIRHATGGTR